MIFGMQVHLKADIDMITETRFCRVAPFRAVEFANSTQGRGHFKSLPTQPVATYNLLCTPMIDVKVPWTKADEGEAGM